MKKRNIWVFGTLLVLCATLSCNGGIFGDRCSAGSMRCNGNTSQMCSSDNSWEDYQNCSSIGERCGTGPSACSGYAGLACCY